MAQQPTPPSPTRKHGLHLRVPVRPDEAATIKAHAQQCGLSTAAFLRNLGLGLPTEALFAPVTVVELSRLNRNVERIAVLLEGWLTKDDRPAVADRAALTRNIQGVLAELQDLRAALRAAVDRW